MLLGSSTTYLTMGCVCSCAIYWTLAFLGDPTTIPTSRPKGKDCPLTWESIKCVPSPSTSSSQQLSQDSYFGNLLACWMELWVVIWTVYSASILNMNNDIYMWYEWMIKATDKRVHNNKWCKMTKLYSQPKFFCTQCMPSVVLLRKKWFKGCILKHPTQMHIQTPNPIKIYNDANLKSGL